MLLHRITWTNLKTLNIVKQINLQYIEYDLLYEVYLIENTHAYVTNIQKTTPANADQTDFENNYKTNANKSLVKPARYSASFLNLAGGTNVTDLVTLQGSATKTVKIAQITINGSSGSNVVIDVSFYRRTAANTGGTPVPATALPLDSTSAAATAVMTGYTANPSALGTGTAFCHRKVLLNGSRNNPSETLSVNWPLVLHGTSEYLAINLNGFNGTGDTYNVYIEWTEE